MALKGLESFDKQGTSIQERFPLPTLIHQCLLRTTIEWAREEDIKYWYQVLSDTTCGNMRRRKSTLRSRVIHSVHNRMDLEVISSKLAPMFRHCRHLDRSSVLFRFDTKIIVRIERGLDYGYKSQQC